MEKQNQGEAGISKNGDDIGNRSDVLAGDQSEDTSNVESEEEIREKKERQRRASTKY